MTMTHCWEDYAGFTGPGICYTAKDKGCGLWLPASDWMFSDRLESLDLSLKATSMGLLPFAHGENEAALPFDVIGAAFFFLSRYEEYLPFTPDTLSRFPAAASMQYQMNALERPLVDEWIAKLGILIQDRFPGLPLRREAYRFQPTYDIDVAYAFLGRPVWRSSGALFREIGRGRFALARHRVSVTRGKAQDPFDHFDLFARWHESLKLEPVYFFLLGRPGPRDRNLNPSHPRLRKLIRRLAASHTIGIHPSFASNDIPGRMEEEKQVLESILGKTVSHSRQHYLRLHLPETYRQLIRAGITHDYTMGFPDHPGFRAGTSCPFPFFDLSAQAETPLTIHPLAVMDGSLRDYLHLNPEEALARMMEILERVKKNGGVMTTLWHNTSLSPETGWQGWKEMYEQFLHLAAE